MAPASSARSAVSARDCDATQLRFGLPAKPRPWPAAWAAQPPATRPLKIAGPSIEPGDRFEVPVEHAAPQVGLDATEVLARQREDLNPVVGCRTPSTT